MTEEPTPQPTVWRLRSYRLMIFSSFDDRLVLSVPLTADQAALIGETMIEREADGLGDYPLDPAGYVCIGP